MNLKDFTESLNETMMYECPDIFGHAREFMTAKKARYRLLDINKYWRSKDKECSFSEGQIKRDIPVWNTDTLKYDRRDVTVVIVHIPDFKFKPDYSLD